MLSLRNESCRCLTEEQQKWIVEAATERYDRYGKAGNRINRLMFPVHLGGRRRFQVECHGEVVTIPPIYLHILEEYCVPIEIRASAGGSAA